MVQSHCQIYLDVKDEKGEVVNWGVESMSPGTMVRDGWAKTSLKAGDQIAITSIPAKNGAPIGLSGGSMGKVAFSDGRLLTFTAKPRE